MCKIHEQVRAGQRQAEQPDPAWAVVHASQVVVARILRVSPEVSVAGNAGFRDHVYEPRVATGPWSDVRRAVVTRLAGEIAAWAVDSHEHIAVYVLAAEIDEWAAGLVPFGVTTERQAAYLAVAAAKRERFQEVMADIVAATFRLVLMNWAVIKAVAVELRPGQELSEEDMERLIDGRAVVPDEVVIWGGADVH